MRLNVRSVLFSLATTGNVLAVQTLVELNYTSYEGTALPNGITQWLGIRYAAPPTGELRFAAPQDPVWQGEWAIEQADTHGPICLATGSGPPSNSTGEDCLFLDVYAPSSGGEGGTGLLPVFFFIQGGGFNANSNPNFNGSGLIAASGGNVVVVTSNYRVGPYGFLAGDEVVESGGTMNNGLRDQRKAMEWVQKYISLFGGDPGHVTMGGDSAGAQSVTLHLTAYNGRNDNLFHATAAESQSFSALRTISESNFAYEGLVIRANCTSALDPLSCLRNLSATDLQSINSNQPFPGAQQNPLYMYGPVLDYDFVTDYTYSAYAKGNFVRVPAIYGDDTNEGTVFVPANTSSLAQSNAFLQGQFPALSLPTLRILNALYPLDPSFLGTSGGPWWRQAANVYGEVRYICPGITISRLSAQAYGVPTWNYHWNVIDPTADAQGYGVTHTVEVNAIFGPENVNGAAPASYAAGGVNEGIVPVVQAYWASFIRAYDPNVYRLSGTPEWEEFTANVGGGWPGWGGPGGEWWKGGGGGGNSQRLMFQTNNTQMESVPEDQLRRCEYLASIGVSLGQ